MDELIDTADNFNFISNFFSGYNRRKGKNAMVDYFKMDITVSI